MKAQYIREAKKEYQDKLELKSKITGYYKEKVKRAEFKEFF